MRTLEGNKSFVYISWGAIFCFSLFVGTLAADLKSTAQTYNPNDIVYAELKKELLEE